MKSSELSKSEILSAEAAHRLFPDSAYLGIDKLLGTNWFIRMCQLLTIGMVLFLQFVLFRKVKVSPANLSGFAGLFSFIKT
jgi:hypothetical protein